MCILYILPSYTRYTLRQCYIPSHISHNMCVYVHVCEEESYAPSCSDIAAVSQH